MLIMLKKQERSQIHNLTYNAWKHFDGVPEDEKGKGRKLISRNFFLKALIEPRGSEQT